jgi:hypothetical protein
MIYDNFTLESYNQLKLHRPSLINDPTFAPGATRIGKVNDDISENFKSNLFSNINYQSNNSESLFLENVPEESNSRNLYDVLDQYYKISNINKF